MKAGLYWSYSTRSLARGGQRTLLAIFCVAVGVLAIVALQLVGNMVNAGLTTNVRDSNGGDVSVRSDIVPLSAQQVATFDQLQTQGTITDYTASSDHSAQSTLGSTPTQFYELRAIDPNKFPISGSPAFVTPGNGSFGSLLSGTTVVVNKLLLDDLKAKVGDTVPVTSDDGRIFQATIGGELQSVGIFRRAQMLIAQSSYAALPSSSGRPVTYGAVYANVAGHSEANAAAAKTVIEKQLPSATVTTAKDALQQNADQVQQIRYFLQVVGLLALLIGGVGIINTMQVLLRRRQTEIAMLKTAGYQRRDLYLLFGLEAAVLGIVGGVIGALAGVGVSFLVKGLVERAFLIFLPVTIDPVTVLSGVAIGFFTALIFGLMPIVQASQIRPLAVLRGDSETTTGTGVLLTIVLSVLLVVLFFLFALSILQNLLVTAGVVIGTGIFLLVLSLVFTLVVFIISKLPVPERLNVPYALLVAVALAIAIGITLYIPAFGILFLVVAALGAVVVVLPRTSKSDVKMSLRNIGRQRARTVTTLVALFIGVFAIGLILVLGQNIKDQINNIISTQVKYNSFVLAQSNDKAAVDAQISQTSGIQGQLVNAVAQGQPVAIKGTPIVQVLQSVPKNSNSTQAGRQEFLSYVSGLQGYDLAAGKVPSDLTIDKGRNLTVADADTGNVLLPTRATGAPLNLNVGDTVTDTSLDGKVTQTYTIVGLYNGGFTAGGMISSNTAAIALAEGHPLYVYQLRLDPNKADQKLHEIQRAVPSIQTFSLTDAVLAINQLLNNLIIMLTAVASLAMIAGIIIIANAVALAMLERRRELGILKSVGFTSRNVLSEVLLENGVIGFTGALLAMLLVLAATVLLGKVLFKIDLGVGVPLVLGIVGVTTLVCMLVAGLVASSATRVRPLEVLRYE